MRDTFIHRQFVSLDVPTIMTGGGDGDGGAISQMETVSIRTRHIESQR